MKRRIGAIALAMGLLLTACGGESQSGGMFREAAGLKPEEILLTVDGREVPAWRYLYWLTDICDLLSGEEGPPDWAAELTPGQTYGDYAR